MLFTSERIDWYSWLAAARCALFSVPFDTSVASVTARLRRLVTCESAPSATCKSPTPSCALVCDWARAVALACRPLTSESPAASSEPELIFDPDDNCCRVLERLVLVLLRLCAAYIADRLFKTPRDMGNSLRCVELRPKTPDACSHSFLLPWAAAAGLYRRICDPFRPAPKRLYSATDIVPPGT